MTKYMDELDWYLVVEDLNPAKINVFEITITSIIIFAIGLMMMVTVVVVISIRERKSAKELADRRMYEDKAEYYRQTDGQRRKT